MRHRRCPEPVSTAHTPELRAAALVQRCDEGISLAGRLNQSCTLGRTKRHARILRLAALVAASEVGVACAQTPEPQLVRAWVVATQWSQLGLHLQTSPCTGPPAAELHCPARTVEAAGLVTVQQALHLGVVRGVARRVRLLRRPPTTHQPLRHIMRGNQ